ncbi:Ca2+-dependent phosphoinositide-specific phospholipase C [Streptomyces sp. NPDC005065]|uniref:Ca2+-dependent phosphoinositide-specific phospholipase C n=1 Tax=Streptomyces sp. NPDC005065 TaxID=3154461 RepID=UPI00339F599E
MHGVELKSVAVGEGAQERAQRGQGTDFTEHGRHSTVAQNVQVVDAVRTCGYAAHDAGDLGAHRRARAGAPARTRRDGLYANPLIRQKAGLPPLDDPDLAGPGLKVMHWADHDYNTTCSTLVKCLGQVKTWSDANPNHVPIPILLELKATDPKMEQLGGPKSPPWDAKQFDRLDTEIRSVFDADDLITPDTIRHRGLTLKESVLRHGWPSLAQARGKFVFLMDNKDAKLQAPYLSGRPNLEGRVLFTDSAPGRADAAFLEENDPTGANTAKIQDWVRKGYLVRTRSDVPFGAARTGDTKQLEAALASGAQIVSTDFPVPGLAARYGSDYVAQLPGGGPARCNPVGAPRSCHTVED